jgi:hypothetical protein
MEVGQVIGDTDIAFCYNPSSPVIRSPAFAHINAGNFMQHFAPYLSFTDKVFTKRVIGDWPPARHRNEYVHYYIHNEVLKNGIKPLTMKSFPWAQQFLKTHEAKYVIQVRNNSRTTNRNSNWMAWVSFLRRRSERFVLIGNKGEIRDELRLPNVIVAKDFDTTMEQDMALVEAADVFMGASSGPATVAIFNSKPYRVFNTNVCHGFVDGYVMDGGRGHFRFSVENQVMIKGAESADLIEKEFEECCK